MITIPEIQTLFLSRNVQVITLIAVLLFLWVITMIIVYYINKKKKKKTLKESAEYILLQISQTPHSDTQMSEMEQIRLFEDLLHSIIPEKKPIIFEVAITNEGSDIQFFIAAPAAYVETVKTQVRRVFERAQAQEVSDYTIFYAQDPSILSTLTLKEFLCTPYSILQKNRNRLICPNPCCIRKCKREANRHGNAVSITKSIKKTNWRDKRCIKRTQKRKKTKTIKTNKSSRERLTSW